MGSGWVRGDHFGRKRADWWVRGGFRWVPVGSRFGDLACVLLEIGGFAWQNYVCWPFVFRKQLSFRSDLTLAYRLRKTLVAT